VVEVAGFDRTGSENFVVAVGVEGVEGVVVVGVVAGRGVAVCGPDDLRGGLVHGADARTVRVLQPPEEVSKLPRHIHM